MGMRPPELKRGQSLFPYGKSGLKLCGRDEKSCRPCCLFPYGKSGLKCYAFCTDENRRTCLFPYGKSGLKFLWQWAWPRGRSSLPVWEEWIEISLTRPSTHTHWSLPVWEEWIEIQGRISPLGSVRSLPVWEEWIEMYLS